jgi:hypothetical protein
MWFGPLLSFVLSAHIHLVVLGVLVLQALGYEISLGSYVGMYLATTGTAALYGLTMAVYELRRTRQRFAWVEATIFFVSSIGLLAFSLLLFSKRNDEADIFLMVYGMFVVLCEICIVRWRGIKTPKRLAFFGVLGLFVILPYLMMQEASPEWWNASTVIFLTLMAMSMLAFEWYTWRHISGRLAEDKYQIRVGLLILTVVAIGLLCILSAAMLTM